MFMDELEELDRRMTRGHVTQRNLLHGIHKHRRDDPEDYVEWRTRHWGAIHVDAERRPASRRSKLTGVRLPGWRRPRE
jgi:hypothetical protein